MTVKRKDFQKIATTIHQFLLKLTDTYECAELRDSLNLSLVQLQKYYRKCQQRLQHTGRYNIDMGGTGYVSPRQSLRITLTRSTEPLSPMTPYIEEPQYFHVQWTVLEESVDRLRRSFSEENVNPQRSIHTPPMHYAAMKGDFEMLMELFIAKPDILEDQDCLGRTPLMYATHYNNIEVVKWLLKNGCDVNSCDFNEITSLHWACYLNNPSMVELLLEAGANINYQDSFGRSAVHWASISNTLESLQVLIDYKANINLHDRNGLTAAMWACRLDNLNHLKVLCRVKNQKIDHIDGYERDRNGRTIIHWSIRRQLPLECLKYLLNEETAQLRDDEGKTVLLLASEQGALETCKIIIEKFGSRFLDDVDDRDRTCIHLSTIGGNGEVVNFLLESGANIYARDKSGATCMDIARNQYLFYCQLIMSSHMREKEKRRDSSTDCVDVIEKMSEKVCIRQNSITETRILIKTPPRPPKSPKSPGESSKSPIHKRRFVKRISSVDQNDISANGFDVMSSDQSNGPLLPVKDETNESKPSDELYPDDFEPYDYKEGEAYDYLNTDTGQEYHQSEQIIKEENLPSPPGNSKTISRAQKVNRIKQYENEEKYQLVTEIPVLDDVSQHRKKKSRRASPVTPETPPIQQSKLNFGAPLEPLDRSKDTQLTDNAKRKRPKDRKRFSRSQDRFPNQSSESNKLSLEDSSRSAQSLENLSKKMNQLREFPNGLNPRWNADSPIRSLHPTTNVRHSGRPVDKRLSDSLPRTSESLPFEEESRKLNDKESRFDSVSRMPNLLIPSHPKKQLPSL